MEQKHIDAIKRRLVHMRKLVLDRRGLFLSTLSHILHKYGVAAANHSDVIKAVYHFITDDIRYIPDPKKLDVYYPPEYTLKRKGGDCDDQASLVATLLNNAGIRVKFRAASLDGQRFTHVYVMAFDGRAWISVDTVNRLGIGREALIKAFIDQEV